MLVAELGLDPKTFCQVVYSLVEGFLDPPLAYLVRLLTLSRSGVIKPLTKDVNSSVAQGVQFSPGELEFVSKLRERLGNHPDMVGSGAVIDWYIVSSGIEELLMSGVEGQTIPAALAPLEMNDAVVFASEVF